MTKLAKLAGTLPFAHLLGVKAARAEESDDEDKKDKPSGRAEGDDEDDEEAKKAKKAESDKPKEGDDKDDDKGAKSKRAESDSDDEDEDGEKDEKASASAMRERARCAKIIAHGINTNAMRQACAYAFDTNMSASVAIATLDATAADRKGGTTLADRMSKTTVQVVAPEAEVSDDKTPKAQASALVGAILAAGKAARGEA